MSFYMGVVPADGPSAQTGLIWSPHQQTQTNPQPPTTIRATSDSSNYATPVTPAQAYARSVVSGQPVLQYTIERSQLHEQSSQQPGPNLQSSIAVSASTRATHQQATLFWTWGIFRQPSSGWPTSSTWCQSISHVECGSYKYSQNCFRS
ncbi:hypothetical protein BDR07DRAFT_366787 [Suillus spraguei]|nr:hypothetical protein BDR07DRAFT_366787 [Suillus spraguei]